MKVVMKYGQASCQCINFYKSSLLVVRESLEMLESRLKIHLESRMRVEWIPSSYLGIPEDISGSKCKLFTFLKERLLNKVNG